MAIDVSLSMQATDVDPDRLQAAQAAASRFIDELPPTLNVGIVSFAGTATVLVSPDQGPAAGQAPRSTTCDLAESTAIGEAIFTSLEALVNAPAADDEEGDELPPARIVLLSDGETTVGRPDSPPRWRRPREAEIPVSTIAFGTEGGTIVYDDPATPSGSPRPSCIPVPVREDNLRAIAEATDGAFFSASSLEELERVYTDIGSAVGFETVRTGRSPTGSSAGGLVLLALSAGLSMLWFQRLP